MPTYSYRCNDCGYEFEQRQRMSDDPLTECPTCDGNVKRVINSIGVVFKGSGFYVTDNRGKKNGTSSTAKKADSDSGGSSSDSKTAESSSSSTSSESKPEKKAAKKETTASKDK